MAKKIYEKYLFENGMTGKISPGEITLKTYHGQPQFMFRKSSIGAVESVARTMLDAVEISKKQKKSEFLELEPVNGSSLVPRMPRQK